MSTKYFSFLSVLTMVGTAVAECLGGWDYALQTLIICMVVDYATGLLCALVWKKSNKSADGSFESKASAKGLLRKGCYLLIVLIAVHLDGLVGTGTVCRTATIMFFTANDGLSILENLGIMGVPFPPAVKNAFTEMKENVKTE